MRLNSPQINLIIKTCMKASRSLIRDFGEIENLQVSTKGPGDFVTSADKRTEKILIEEIQKAHPEHGIITEETGIINKSNVEKKFNFLYIDGENCHFMDNSTFEQVEISKSITGEKYKLLKENLEVTISFMEEKPISMDLPNNIECTIETTDAAIKNQTASSSYKPAILDCGIKINVPPFIESGEKIIIDTRTLEYVKRAN